MTRSKQQAPWSLPRWRLSAQDCNLVYALVPRADNVLELIEDRAPSDA
ncbi:MAG TPA: hypothetical protein VI320_03620 [Terracidiphilus sp.]|jgi:hypothetical protein